MVLFVQRSRRQNDRWNNMELYALLKQLGSGIPGMKLNLHIQQLKPQLFQNLGVNSDLKSQTGTDLSLDGCFSQTAQSVQINFSKTTHHPRGVLQAPRNGVKPGLAPTSRPHI